MNIKLFDIVALRQPLRLASAWPSGQQLNLPAGRTGTVVHIYPNGDLTVEFSDERGVALAIEDLDAASVELMVSASTPAHAP